MISTGYGLSEYLYLSVSRLHPSCWIKSQQILHMAFHEHLDVFFIPDISIRLPVFPPTGPLYLRHGPKTTGSVQN